MPKVTIIGGSVIDLFLYPHHHMNLHDSNPGYLKKSLGGVGRNIAENLSRLGIQTTLITPLGQDHYQAMILDQAKAIGLNICSIPILETPLYVSVMDEKGEDLVGVAVMDDIQKMTVKDILIYQPYIDEADILVMDTNLSRDVLSYFLKKYQHKMYMDAISGQKAIKLRDLLPYIHTLKLNLIEAMTLAGFGDDTKEGLHALGHYFIDQGIDEIYITLGEKGAYYKNKDKTLFQKPIPIQIQGATGAGDAFFAGVIYAAAHNKEGLSYGIANAYFNLKDPHAVNPILTSEILENIIKEWSL
jgi:pseudouridine kinase